MSNCQAAEILYACVQEQPLGGPRIKHVCRAAAVALGQPRAMVPDDIPRLSALPLHEREGITFSPAAEGSVSTHVFVKPECKNHHLVTFYVGKKHVREPVAVRFTVKLQISTEHIFGVPEFLRGCNSSFTVRVPLVSVRIRHQDYLGWLTCVYVATEHCKYNLQC